mmetsp:Transcript_39444/g.84054  ORF Transcript_39444/g.84054 Transcript_39444/m.84054 type:complete len:225 (+) Transcript_39444:81-755(+)
MQHRRCLLWRAQRSIIVVIVVVVVLAVITSSALFWGVDHNTLRSEHHRSDGSGVLQSRARDLCWVDDACRGHVGEVLHESIIAIFEIFILEHFLRDEFAIAARVFGNFSHRGDHRIRNDNRPFILIVGEVLNSPVTKLLRQVAEGRAAAWQDALVHCRLGRINRILQPQLLILQLDLGGGPHFDERDATSELGEALLELLLGVVALCLLNLTTELGAALLQGVL